MIGDAISIVEFLRSHADDISTWFIGISIVLAFLIGIAEYKSKLGKYIIHHRNKWWFVFLLASFAGILAMRKRGIISGGWLIVDSVIWAAYGISCIMSLQEKVFHHFKNPILRHYEKQLYKGSAIEHLNFFKKKHWYLWTREEKLEYMMLSAMYFQEVKDIQNAYRALEKIDAKWIYPSEKKDINTCKAILLVQMGSMKSASRLLGSPESNDSKDPNVWMAYAFISEAAGDIDTAYSYAEKAKTLLEIDSSGLQAVKQGEIYNNFYRYALMKGNTGEALYAIEHAWEKVKKTGDMRIIPTVASNRIIRKAIAGKSSSECEAAIEEFKTLVPKNEFANQIEVENCEIYYYRHIGDEQKVNEIIKKGFLTFVDKLSSSQKACFIQSTFVMLMNGHYDYRWLSPYICTSEKKYKDLSVMDRLTIFKGYMAIFQQEEFRTICKKKPYHDLRRLILRYYEKDALRDIDELLGQIESYNVYQYLELSIQRLGILKLIEGKDHIVKSKKAYIDLYKELYDKGLHIDAIRVLMILIDECGSPYNILMWSPFWGRSPMLYSDYIECSTPPDPVILKDGIHLRYPRLGVYPLTEIKPLQDTVIHEHVDFILTEMKKWKNHPARIDMSAEIAHILQCIGRKDEAREILEFFKNSGVSVNQFSSWMKEEIQALCIELYE